MIPATAAFLSWYALYVLMSMFAHDFMATKVVGNINVALVLGLLQFVTTFLIAWLYSHHNQRRHQRQLPNRRSSHRPPPPRRRKRRNLRRRPHPR